MSTPINSCPYLHDASFALDPSSDLDLGTLTLADRYKWSTDNAGTPAHSLSGPNLYLDDLVTGRRRAITRSIGQLAVFLQDESLANSGSVSHALQLHFSSTGVHQTASGFGTGIQVFMTDDQDVLSEAGNIQIVWANPITHTSYVDILARLAGVGALCGRFQWDGTIMAANTAGGQFIAPYFAASSNYGQLSGGNVLFDGSTTGHFAGAAGGTGVAVCFLTGFTGRFIDCQLNGTSLFRVGNAGQVVCTLSDTANTSPSAALILDHVLTSGSPANGFGTLITFRSKDTGATTVSAGQIKVENTTSTPGGVTSTMTFQTIKAGTLTSAAFIDSNSNWAGLFKGLFTGGIGVGNSAAATTLTAPGTVTKKVEVFDASGASLGFLALYSSGSFS